MRNLLTPDPSSHRHSRTSSRILVVAAAFGIAAGSASAALAVATPAQKCAAAKQKAAAKKASAKIACHAKAILKGLSVDPECLVKAELKFNDAFARAEARGGCLTVGDTAAIEATVDSFVDSVVGALPAGPKRIFVTSTTTNGNMGGLAGGDAICAARASAAGLSGVYKAWLSSDSVSAASRLSHATVPYERTDGITVANDWADLVDGTLSAAISVDEFGSPVGLSTAYTGSGDDGSASPGSTCAGWTTASAGVLGIAGVVGATSGWSAVGTPACNGAASIYCVEQ